MYRKRAHMPNERKNEWNKKSTLDKVEAVCYNTDREPIRRRPKNESKVSRGSYPQPPVSPSVSADGSLFRSIVKPANQFPHTGTNRIRTGYHRNDIRNKSQKLHFAPPFKNNLSRKGYFGNHNPPPGGRPPSCLSIPYGIIIPYPDYFVNTKISPLSLPPKIKLNNLPP